MYQDSKVAALMRRLAIAEDGNYSEYRLFCCGDRSYMEYPALVIREDGTGEIEMDCICRSRRTPRIMHAIDLPGFRSGNELAEWLLTHGADAMLERWRTAAETNPASTSISWLVRRLQNLADSNRGGGRGARYWPFRPEETLELMGWSAGDPPLQEEEVKRVMEFVACRDNLDLPRPRHWARWTQEANSIAKGREAQTRRSQHLRLAVDPGTPPAQLRSLLADGDPRIAAAVLRNPAAPDDLKAWATLLLPAPGSFPCAEEAPF